MNKTLVWQWWKDPLAIDDEWVDARSKKPPRRDRRYYDEEVVGVKEQLVRPFASTAAGLVPLSVYGELSRHFNFWIGHANFTLEADDPGHPGHTTLIKQVDGVETFDILTRYRFRVGIGLAFDDSATRRAIEGALGVAPPEPKERAPEGCDATLGGEFEAAQRRAIAEGWEYWVVVLRPDRPVRSYRFRDRARMAAAVLKIAEKAGPGGRIVTSHD